MSPVASPASAGAIASADGSATAAVRAVVATVPDPELPVVTVEDHGPGVQEAELETIFTPFQRASDLSRPGGAGLGLAIVRRAMEVHGGSASATQRPGEGLLVTLRLPLRPDEGA